MKRKAKGIVESAMRNHIIVIIIAVTLMLIGVVALLKMPRNEFPQFTIRQGLVIGVYPGATSEEVEAQLTKEVENYIFGFQEVKKSKTYSLSQEGIVYVFVELNDDVKNADQFWSKFRHGLEELKMSLPSGVLALIANSDFGDTSALLVTLSSDTKSYKELEFALEKLEAECRKIPASSKIKHFGLQKEKIFVNVKPELLNEYNIKSISLLGSYMPNGMVNSAGTLKDGKTNLAVHLPPNFESEKDLAEQIVYSDPQGNVVRLKDIASIERKYDEPDNYIKQNGKKTILLSLEMQPGNNIVEFGKDVEKAIGDFKKQISPDIHVSKISELPKYVDESVTGFMKEFIMAIVAVILVTLLLLPFRVASVAGITVPISVLITLCFLYFFGIELHTVSLAALIIVLGMIVDNSIVVIDNHVEKMDHGGSPWHAAIRSAKELVAPIIVATLAIMAAYIPLGFMVPGSAGEFLMSLPLVISIALIVSVLVAIFLVPYINFIFIKKGLKQGKTDNKRSFLDKIQSIFDKSLEKAFRFPKIAFSVAIALILFSFGLFNSLDQQLFPEMERNQFAVEVYLPVGSSLESTAKVVDSLENVLMKDKRVTNVTSFIGTSSPRFHTVYAPNMPSPNYGQLLVNTVSNKATREIVKKYSPVYSDNFANAHVKWKILTMQFTKAPIEIRISSDSIKDIRKIEKEINSILHKTKHISWIRIDWDQKLQSIRVNLERDKANRMGYTKSSVSTSILVGLNGMPLTTIWEQDYPVEVRLSQNNGEKKDIKTLENQYINSISTFSALPLRSFANFSPEWTEGTIVRRNGTKTLTILVDNSPEVMASGIFEEIKPKIDQLSLPFGTSISYGGDYEGQGETFIPMAIALALSIVVIFFILLFQFKRVKIAALIMSTMLLAIPGAAIGLTVMNYPFSITAFIGITSLCGMVVRNGIILIDYARELREHQRMPVREAALAAGKRRMRPIFLTAAAAAVGVIPMILSRSPLWGPLGTVICFGLLISMVLTLYILPLLYSAAYSSSKLKTSTGKMKTAPVVTLLAFALLLSVNTSKAQVLSIDSCKQFALENNKKIKEADFEIKLSSEVRKNAFTNYFPNVSASALSMRSADYLVKGKIPSMNLPVYDGNPANLQNPTLFTYVPEIPLNILDYFNTASITVALPLYTGGRISNGNKLAKLGEDISKQKKGLTSTEVLLKTEELYWNLVSLKEKKKTIESYQLLLENLSKDVENYQKAGMAQRNDLLKVNIKQNELKNNSYKLENGIVMLSQALCQHVGISYSNSMELSSLPEENGTLQSIASTENLIKNRIEMQMLSKGLEAKKLQKKMTEGEFLPQLTLGGQGFYFDAMKSKDLNAFAFINLSIPISDWWGGSHKIKQNKLEISKMQNQYDETSELLKLQVIQATNELNESIYQIQLFQLTIDQSKENLRITEDSYKAGTIGISDLLEAQAIYQSALDNLVDAKCNYQIKKAKYQQAIGTYK